jgi:transposase InsO family protein
VQYASHAYTAVLKEYGIRISMSRTGNPTFHRIMWWKRVSRSLKASRGEDLRIPSDLVVDQWVSNVESSSPRDVL